MTCKSLRSPPSPGTGRPGSAPLWNGPRMCCGSGGPAANSKTARGRRFRHILANLPGPGNALAQQRPFSVRCTGLCPAHLCERVPWAPVYPRRTTAYLRWVLTLAWEMSASAAQRIADATGIHGSRSTINRWLLKAQELRRPRRPGPPPPTPRPRFPRRRWSGSMTGRGKKASAMARWSWI